MYANEAFNTPLTQISINWSNVSQTYLKIKKS